MSGLLVEFYDEHFDPALGKTVIASRVEEHEGCTHELDDGTLKVIELDTDAEVCGYARGVWRRWLYKEDAK